MTNFESPRLLPEDDSLKAIRQRMKELSQLQLETAVGRAIQSDPQRAARMMQSGLSADTPDDLYSYSQQMSGRQGIMMATEQSPLASKFFREPDWAAVSWDLPEEPGVIENVMSSLESGRLMTEAALRGLEIAGLETLASLSNFSASFSQSLFGGEAPPESQAALFLQPLIDELRRQGIAYTAAAEEEAVKSDSIIGQAFYGAIQSTPMMALAIVASLASGGTAGPALATMGGLTGGLSYEQARAQGLSQMESLSFGAMQGTIEAAAEAIPFARFLKNIRIGSPLGKALRDQVFAEAASEAATEVGQSFYEWSILPENQDVSVLDFLAAAPRNILVAGLSGAFMGAGMGGASYTLGRVLGDQTSQEARAEAAATAVKRLSEASQQSELRQRAPAVFRALVDLGQEDNIFRVESRVLNDIVNNTIGIGELARTQPDVAARLNEAGLEPGTEIELTPGEFVDLIGDGKQEARNALRDALQDNLYVNDNKLTVTESQLAQQEAPAFVDAIEQTEQSAFEQQQEFDAELNDAEADLLRDLGVAEEDIETFDAEEAVSPEEVAETQAAEPEIATEAEQLTQAAVEAGVITEEQAAAATEVVKALTPQEAAPEVAAVVQKPPQPTKVQQERVAMRDWFGQSVAKDGAGRPIRMAARELTGEPGAAAYSESPFGEGGVAISMQNPLELTGNNANAVIANPKARQKALDKARAAGKDGVIAYGKRKGRDGKVVRDTIYIPLDEAQARPISSDPEILFSRPLDEDDAQPTATPEEAEEYRRLAKDVSTPYTEYVSKWQSSDWSSPEQASLDFAKNSYEIARLQYEDDPAIRGMTELVDAAAQRVAKYAFPIFHGLGEGYLYGRSFDPSRLGSATQAKSAELGFFGAKKLKTSIYYANSYEGKTIPEKESEDILYEYAAKVNADQANMFNEMLGSLASSITSVASPDVIYDFDGNVDAAFKYIDLILPGRLSEDEFSRVFPVSFKISRDVAGGLYSMEKTTDGYTWRPKKASEVANSIIDGFYSAESRLLYSSKESDIRQFFSRYKVRHQIAQEMVLGRGYVPGKLDITENWRGSSLLNKITDIYRASIFIREALSNAVAEAQNGATLPDGVNIKTLRALLASVNRFSENAKSSIQSERIRVRDIRESFIVEAERAAQKEIDITIAPPAGVFRGYMFMNNPLFYDAVGRNYGFVSYSEIIEKALNNGHDGVVIKNTADPYEWDDIYVVFRPEQIKSREPVLYETEARGGGLIGLEERFNLLTDDVYYSKDLGLDDSTPSPPGAEKAAVKLFMNMVGNLAKAMKISPSALLNAYKLGIQRGDVDGRASYKPKDLLITLSEKATALDIQHELTHHFMHILFTAASDPSASPETRAMAEQVLALYKDKDGNQVAPTVDDWNNLPEAMKVEFHETLADWFTLYTTENKAPSKGVRRVMEILSRFFRASYSNIYNVLNKRYREQFGKDLPALTDDVRIVFGAMIASERAVRAAMAADGATPQFQTQDESGMTDEEWSEYQDLRVMEEEMAIADLTSKSVQAAKWFGREVNGMVRQLQRQVSQLRSRVRREVEEEVYQETVYVLRNRLRGGKVWQDGKLVQVGDAPKLNAKKVREALGDAATEADGGAQGTISLSGQYGKNGLLAKNGALDPELVADANGFASVADMMRQLVEAESAKDKIDRLVGERLAAQYSQFHDKKTGRVDPAKIQRAAIDAIGSPQFAAEVRARITALELKALDRAGRPVRVLREAASSAARKRLAGIKLNKISPARHRASALRANRLAHQVMRDGYDRVLRAAQQKVQAAQKALQKKEAEAPEVAPSRTRLESAQAELQFVQDIAPAETMAAATVTGEGQAQRLVIRAKRNQLAQEALDRESTIAKNEVSKAKEYLKRLGGNAKRERLGANFSDLIDGILVLFKDGKSATAASMGGRNVPTWDTKKILDALAEEGRFIEEDQIELEFFETVRQEAANSPDGRFDINELTLEQFRDLMDLIKMLEHVGRSDQELLTSERKQLVQDTKDTLNSSIEANSKNGRRARRESKKWGESLAKKVNKFAFLAHTRMYTLCYILDGGKTGGPAWDFFANSANKVEAERLGELMRVTREVNAIINPLLGPLRRRFKRDVGELAGLSDARRASKGRTTFTVEEVFMMLVNMGNDGNKSRLLFGEGWEEADVMRAIGEVLTKEEVEAAQKIWDLFESFWPRIDALERKVYGVSPIKVDRTPLTITMADGSQVSLKGGYTPVVYDAESSTTQSDKDAADAAKSDLGYINTSATTKRTHAMRRGNVGTGDPLSLYTDGMLRGFNDIVHDLHWRPWLIDMRSVFTKSVKKTITETYGADTAKEIDRWIRDIANANRRQVANEDSWFRWIAQNSSFAKLAFSASSAVLQLTGIATIPMRVGPVAFAKGLAKFISGGRSMLLPLKEIGELDPAMAVRFETTNRELNEVVGRIRGKSPALEWIYRKGMVPLLYLQSIVDGIAWHAGMAYAQDRGIVELDKQIDIARQTVYETQGDQGLPSLASAERGDAIKRLFTVFISYPVTILNLRRTIAADSEIGKLNKVTRMIALAVLLPALEVLLKDALAPDEEEREDLALWYAKKIGIASTRQLFFDPFIGLREFADIANTLFGDDYQRGYEGPAGLTNVGSMLGLTRQLYRIATDEKDLFDQDMKMLLTELSNVMGWFLPFPSVQFNRMVKGYYRITEDDAPPHAIIFGTQK